MDLRQLRSLSRSEQVMMGVSLCIWVSACVVVGLNAAAARGWPDWTGATIGALAGLGTFVGLNLPRWKVAGAALLWPGIALGFLLVLGGRGLLANAWPWGALLYVLLVLVGGPVLLFGGIRLAELLGGKLGEETGEPDGQ